MPVLVPEDGTGLSNSNSYISLAEADQYFATHPYYADNWSDMGDPDKEMLLMMATQSLDSLMIWRGSIVSVTQALSWPRTGVYDNEGRLIASNIVPQNVKWATAEMAFHISQGKSASAGTPQSQGLEKLKIDVIELQFGQSTNVSPVPAASLLLLNGLGEYALSSRVRRVYVG